MKALIVWADNKSSNLGVRALGAGTAQLLRSALPGIDLSFQAHAPGDSPVALGPAKVQAKRLLERESELGEWIKTFDMVVDTRAGDSFADIYGLRRLLTMSLFAELVTKSGVPLVMSPQTIGPFATRRGRLIAKRSMHHARLVMARDSSSAEQAQQLGTRVDVLATDVAFALDPPVKAVSRDIIINPSGLLWFPNQHVDCARYREAVVAICQTLIQRGRRVTVMAHVIDSPSSDNDVPAVRDLAQTLGDGVETCIPVDLEEARAVLSSANAVVAARMHACLNALAVGTAAVSMAYSRKFQPLLSDLGWPHSVDIRTAGPHATTVLRMLDSPTLASSVAGVRERAQERLALAASALSGAG